MRKFAVVFICIIAVTAFANADIYVKTKMHQDAYSVMGQSQPAEDSVSEQWIGKDQVAMIQKGSGFIVDLKKNVMYMINHAEKTYVEAALPLDMSKLFPPEMAAMLKGMMKMSVSVTPGGQTKAIGQWKCENYAVDITMMMPIKMTVWATTDVPFDLNAYVDNMQVNMLAAQFQLDTKAIAEMKKIRGFWIASETVVDMMGSKMKTSTEVVEITQKTPPAGIYTVPSGYTKKDFISMQGR
jgi:hypothetical protein